MNRTILAPLVRESGALGEASTGSSLGLGCAGRGRRGIWRQLAAKFLNRLFKNSVHGEVMHPNLRRHKLVQQRAEQGGERGVLAPVNCELPVKAINIGDNLVLLFKRRHRDREAAQARSADIA